MHAVPQIWLRRRAPATHDAEGTQQPETAPAVQLPVKSQASPSTPEGKASSQRVSTPPSEPASELGLWEVPQPAKASRRRTTPQGPVPGLAICIMGASNSKEHAKSTRVSPW